MAGNCHFKVYLYFNPRTPRGVRPLATLGQTVSNVFQSTHPARGATHPASLIPFRSMDFNPRTPRGVRLVVPILNPFKGYFNPRTPRGVRPYVGALQGIAGQFQSTHPARGATRYPLNSSYDRQFQSTHPARGATGWISALVAQMGISIHAPREGCDLQVGLLSLAVGAISIHAPREGCDVGLPDIVSSPVRFQSTHPARGATSH